MRWGVVSAEGWGLTDLVAHVHGGLRDVMRCLERMDGAGRWEANCFFGGSLVRGRHVLIEAGGRTEPGLEHCGGPGGGGGRGRLALEVWASRECSASDGSAPSPAAASPAAAGGLLGAGFAASVAGEGDVGRLSGCASAAMTAAGAPPSTSTSTSPPCLAAPSLASCRVPPLPGPSPASSSSSCAAVPAASAPTQSQISKTQIRPQRKLSM